METMDKKLTGKRILASVFAGSIKEYKIIEISPSGKWIKLKLISDNHILWVNPFVIHIIEILDN